LSSTRNISSGTFYCVLSIPYLFQKKSIFGFSNESKNSMTFQEIIKKRLPIILLTTPVIGLMIATPIFLSTGTPIAKLPWVALMISVLSLVSWLLNITFFLFFPAKFRAFFWKWLASTICMIAAVSSLHFITINLVSFQTQYVWLIRSVNITAVNTIIFIINMLIDTRETKLQLENENNQLKISQLEAQLAQLKNQINPHFLFNALSSLKSLMRRNPQMAESYLMKLSEFLRVSIGQNKDLVTLKDELQLCNDYIDLQKIRFQKGLIYETDIDPNSLNDKIPFFALQSLLENALKHNSLDLEKPLKIRIEVKNENVLVSNNIQEKFSMQTNSQTGLHNLNERLKIHTGEPMIITKDEQFFKVQLKLIKA
jgi:two-component system LytT family sensor kinase